MSSTAKLGAFILVALILVGVFIINIERIPLRGGGARVLVRASFPSVAGLDEKSPVRIAGVRVGIVENIALKDDHALATLSLEPGIALREGAKAEVRSLGMLGEEYVELDPGPKGAPPLPPGTELKGESPAGFDEVLKTAAGVGGDVKSVTTSLRQALGGPEGEKRIEEILDNIRSLTADMRALVAGNRAQVDATLANLRDFSATLKEELPRLAAKLEKLADGVDAVVSENRDNIDATVANVKELSARLRTSADNLNDITGKISRGQGSIGKLVNDDTTVKNLNSALTSVESGVQSLRDTIGRPERWKLDVGVRAEALPGPGDSRSSFGVDLHTAKHRFYRAGVVSSPEGKRRKTTEEITDTLPDGSERTLIEERLKTTDAFTFNAQVGYRLGDTILRAGLFESQGGGGIDYLAWRDRVGLTLEAYDFDRPQKAPHIRLEGRWFINRNLYAYTGWDDPRLSDRSSVILGAGITWRDEDLKYLLGSAASLRP